MKQFIVAITFVILLSAVGAFAQVEFNAAQYRLNYKKYVLKNGLTLIVHEDHSVPIVGVHVWYHVGSRNEKRGKTGFAHLFEHFFFNGSENFPHGFREAMDDLGANNRNGTTNSDRTDFFEDVPVSALEKTLFLEADRMGFLGGYISQEMLERERGVVKNEKRQGENAPYGRVFGEIVGKIYPYSHPYSWTTIGEMDDLNAATLEDVKQWYKTYYGPNNAVISLAGDITPEKAYELVNKYFGDIPPGPPLPRMEEWIPNFGNNMRDEMEDRVPQARIYRIYFAPSWENPSLANLELFADVLAGSKSAVLTKTLVYDKKLATSVFASVNDSELAGLFMIVATVQPGIAPKTVETEIDRLVDETLKTGVDVATLKRYQNRNLAQFLRRSETIGGRSGRAAILAEGQTFGNDPENYLKRLEWMAAASPQDVYKTAREWLARNSYTMVVKPMKEYEADITRVNRSKVPELGQASDVSFPKVQRAKLKNGLNVILLERHSVPIVNLTLAVDAGAASDALAKAGNASLALSLIADGTTKRNSFQVSDELDSLGAEIVADNTADMSFVSLRAIKSKLQPSLNIFADVVQNPAFREEQFESGKKRMLASIAQSKANANLLGTNITREILYGKSHPYGKPNSGFENTVSALTRGDLVQWHKTWFLPQNSTLVVAGDTTINEVMPMLEAEFGGWKGKKAPKKTIAAVPNVPGKQIFLIDKPNAPQSVIIAAHTDPPSGQKEDLAAQAVFTDFGGMSTSRLNRNLRLDKHWSYGTRASLDDVRGSRMFMAIAPVQTDKTKEAIIEIAKEIRDISGNRPITGEEFESIMRNMTSRLPGRFETLNSLESAGTDIVNLLLADDYWANYAANMRKLTEADLAAAGKKFVRPDDVVWVIVGDLKKIESGIRELQIGKVTVLDSNGNPVR
ncbi:MAG: M16 family metallopeptidase [Pyrinomonadaceae bacterium]